jgi:GT2 family glycosyltransferase
MILGCPAYQNHRLTAAMVESLAETVTGPDFTLVIVDNGSPRPYRAKSFRIPFRVEVIRNERNEGNFWPLAQVAQLDPASSVVALCHNDMLFYERGWDRRVADAFRDDPLLGMVGFAGSDGIDRDGKRASTMSNLRGTRGHISAEKAGTRITDLRPAAAVDGLFMAFRREALASLTLIPAMPPAHFYDFIWGAQVIQAGWRLGTLGIECDHVGWSTEGRLAEELDGEWRRWCAEQGIDPGPDPMAAIWAAGERSWHDGFGGGRFFPCRVGSDWIRRPTGMVAAVSMFRNEEDVAEQVIRHMLAECDLVVVADNNSTDRSRELLEAIGDPRLFIYDEPSFAYRQSETMNRMAAAAVGAGADWIVPFDFDEWWYSEEGRIGDVLLGLPPDVVLTMTEGCDMIPQPSDPGDSDPFRRITWTRPGSLWSLPDTRKVAYRPGADRVLMQGNHGLLGHPRPEPGPLRIRHYPFRTYDQAAAKLRHGRAAVLAANAPANSGGHWQKWGGYSDDELRSWWAEWTNPEGLVPG